MGCHIYVFRQPSYWSNVLVHFRITQSLGRRFEGEALMICLVWYMYWLFVWFGLGCYGEEVARENKEVARERERETERDRKRERVRRTVTRATISYCGPQFRTARTSYIYIYRHNHCQEFHFGSAKTEIECSILAKFKIQFKIQFEISHKLCIND